MSFSQKLQNLKKLYSKNMKKAEQHTQRVKKVQMISLSNRTYYDSQELDYYALPLFA